MYAIRSYYGQPGARDSCGDARDDVSLVGLQILAIAVESVIKLVAFITVGLFVSFWLFRNNFV